MRRPARSSVRLAALVVATALVAFPAALAAQRGPARADAPAHPRIIKRDIPLTNMIRRAFAAGTRDSTGRPGRNYWQTWVEYDIDARLEPSTSIITGRETVVLHNASDSAMTSIGLRLDQNVFAPNVPRSDPVIEITEGMRVTKLALDGTPVDLAAVPAGRGRGAGPGGAAGAAPPRVTVTGLSQTFARVNLVSPIPPKGRATLEIEWNFRLPRADNVRGDRLGRWADTLYQVAQWYPRIAKYDDLRGWDTDPYLIGSEFYNNFGKFDVRLDVPAGWLVGATGVLQNPEQVLTPTARERLARVLDSDSTRTIVSAAEAGPGRATAAGERLVWRFTADTVNDFAWATARNFVWDATRATIPGRGPIPVHIFYLPGRATNYAQAGPTMRHALEFYSKLWMPFAFPQQTIVDGPETGMEFPMFIMSSVGAADHEVGHQWWPMMVGTNETWYGWMDEGFDQWMNGLSRQARQNQPLSADNIGMRYGLTSGDEREAPLMWNANYGGPNYTFQAYSKSPMMLSMLGGIVGDSAVFRAHSEYAKAWRFKHPSPWDYMFFMSNALKRESAQDLGWFWYAWLFTTDAVHGRIDTVRTAGARTTVVVRQEGEMPAPVVLKVRFAPTGAPIRPMPNAKMVDSATAIVTWPVDVWFGGRRTFQAELNFGARKIERIVLDPGCRFPDRVASDNVWPRDAAPAAPAVGRGGGGGGGFNAPACPS